MNTVNKNVEHLSEGDVLVTHTTSGRSITTKIRKITENSDLYSKNNRPFRNIFWNKRDYVPMDPFSVVEIRA